MFYYLTYYSSGAQNLPSASRTNAGGKWGAIRSETNYAALNIAIFFALRLYVAESRGTGIEAT